MTVALPRFMIRTASGLFSIQAVQLADSNENQLSCF